ncbi:hypothetical protein TPHA_0G02870 [Tetrapisispora phaffii CBS 4417]|uniref:Mediator of RNA polymerase II transcription subunit 11 n=1 Tax=Tetrapisispora phaffii (strain ATCC 24235 / CBS 4417 / NBRC 1672 / NRRL Y-8282 / UCD 70-5) TaxID=1071381 RepID=G8BW47_TETPH|nr:hypothetical protein TPHA_0G02870 [Tetrapisispora phaffii CBS 4417]CCE64125.1 hypothetical protein TPHA_0G02870 [Tetrapisispora phaffii CBS 4417]
MQSEYVQERLASLNKVDDKLCSLLKEVSQMVYTFSELKRGNETLKPNFNEHIKEFFDTLDSATSSLHKEIELLDENTGTRVLPINVNKKALGQDTEKMKEQMQLLKVLLQSDK